MFSQIGKTDEGKQWHRIKQAYLSDTKKQKQKTQKLNKMESTLYEEHNSSHTLKHLNTKGTQTCRTVFKKDSDLHDYMTKTQLSVAWIGPCSKSHSEW